DCGERTEWEVMKELGYDRIWDCGKTRYVWTNFKNIQMNIDNIITRLEAIRLGSKTYYTGKPCKNGHIAKRKTINGGCLICHNQQLDAKRSEYSKTYYERNKEIILEKQSQYREEYPEKRKAASDKYRRNNIDKHNATNAAWRKNNPDYYREYYTDSEVKEKHAIRAKN